MNKTIGVGFKATVAAIALLLASRGAAQDPETRLKNMESRLGALQGEVERRAAREDELDAKVRALEARLKERESAETARLRDLEDRLTGRSSEIDRAIERVASIERSPAAASRLSVGGYFDFEIRNDNGTDRFTFDQHRFVLKFDGAVTDFLGFRSEIEFEGGGAGASYLSDNYVAVEYAELLFSFDRAFNLKAGALLMPFTRFNALHDSPLQDLTDRPFVNTFVVPTTWTDAGVGAYGGVDLGGVRLDYDVVVTNGLDQGFSSIPGGGLRDGRSSFRRDNNDNKQVAGRLGVTPEFECFDGLNFGFSGLWGRYDDQNSQSISMFGLDLLARKGPFELVGEAVWANLDRTSALEMAGAPGGLSGWYAEGRFHFFPEALRGGGWFGPEATFTLVFRAESVDTDDSATAIDFVGRKEAFRDDVERYTVGFNFRPVEKTVLKFEYQFLLEPGGFGVSNDRFVVSFAASF